MLAGQKKSRRQAPSLSNRGRAERLLDAHTIQQPEASMKYACLVYHEEEKLNSLSQAQMDGLVGACMNWVEDLERGGHHIFSVGLQSLRTATTVRHRNGSLSLTDGPFAETKEFLGGLTLINARDLNEAIQLASKFPSARLGSMEVRPVLEADCAQTDPLDQKIAAAILRNAPEVEPTAAARMASLPQTASIEKI
ncbi:MAG TPA: YciI family protein [Planctomycetaceae bacterium]|nr:YciI family protein [Planctomycetaceae bacterium]